ncbi:YidH family protein [Nocardioides sp. NPDC057577]|uniref:YidH family protein n=1 Tax=Nocardioides sp. NPDC057577 TaxID=3346171 RepID=UPI003672AB1A
MNRAARGRLDSWLYRETEEPDVRFTLANERTFLAWIRTSLAFLAVAVAVDTLEVGGGTALAVLAPLSLALLAAGCAAWSWWSWIRSERAIRRRDALPGRRAPLPLVFGVLGSIALVSLALLA